VGDSSDLEDILSSLNQISLQNKSFLKECVAKIEQEAVFGDVNSLPVKRQKSENHVTASFLETNPLALDLISNA
jgi:hypothetical protein